MTKSLILSALFLAVSFQVVLAQCTRSGTFVQSDPVYFLSGSANVTYAMDGSKSLIFEDDFQSVQGADLRVYLSKDADILAAGSEAIEITTSPLLGDNGRTSPPQSPITGMKTFPISDAMFPDIQIEDFNFIVIQCIAINERWGYVDLGPEDGPDCEATSSVEDVLTNSVSFSPNPVKNNIEISNASLLDLKVSVLDASGKEVIETNKVTSNQQTIDLSSLVPGIYFLQIKAGANVVAERFVKE